ncbi:MAG TPA: hypothetical protein VIX86_03575 [Streptosporangiaceae bacterium]
MTTHLRRSRSSTVAAALGAMAVIAAAVCAAPSPAAAAGRPEHQLGTTPYGVPVVISCIGHAQTRPGSYTLACADGNAYLTGLHWAAWGSDSAFATGTDSFNVCIPTCTAGHLHSFPVLAALWRTELRPAHPGQRYFTRLTVIDTGSRSYRAGGKTYHLPLTVTYPLSPAGGA